MSTVQPVAREHGRAPNGKHLRRELVQPDLASQVVDARAAQPSASRRARSRPGPSARSSGPIMVTAVIPIERRAVTAMTRPFEPGAVGPRNNNFADGLPAHLPADIQGMDKQPVDPGFQGRMGRVSRDTGRRYGRREAPRTRPAPRSDRAREGRGDQGCRTSSSRSAGWNQKFRPPALHVAALPRECIDRWYTESGDVRVRSRWKGLVEEKPSQDEDDALPEPDCDPGLPAASPLPTPAPAPERPCARRPPADAAGRGGGTWTARRAVL